MADNSIESPSFFGIEETMNMGAGNAELLKDLLTPESASSNPDEIEPIEEEPVTPAKKETTKKKEKGADEPEEVNEEKEKAQSLLTDLLAGDEEDTENPEKPDTKEKEEEPGEVSPFNTLAKDLQRLGVFTLEDDEEEINISTGEEFLERFQSEKKKAATELIDNFIGRFGEDYQNAFDAIYVKGVNPKEYFNAYNAVVDYAKLDMTKEQNQEQVVRQALTDQGFEPEDIDSEIERLKSYADLETVAAKHHKVLVKKEAVKLQQMEQEAEETLKQKTAIKTQYVNNVQGILQEKLKTKEFDGIPINPKLATELQDFLLVEKWKTPSGEVLTDFDRAILELKRPENHATKVKVGLLLKIMEKDPTLSTIQKSGVTKKTNELFTATTRQLEKSKSTSGSKPSPWFT